jgi:SAM-dependent methyltransferase
VNVNTEEVKKVVKGRYGKAAERGGGKGCCCATEVSSSLNFATEHGLYGQEELSLVPEIARNLSRGCGNPTGFADLQSGEVVVDLGCGAGIDVILAARKVGPSGKVVGVDFAPQMIERAKQAVVEAGLSNSVEFVVADMEQLNLPDSLADVVTSNCVINLSPDKDAVYRQAFRILKPGGRLAISDIVLTEKIEPHVQARLQSTWSGCLGGTIAEESYFDIISKAGFRQVKIVASHALASQELDEMVCCPGPEFTPAPAKEDLAVVQGKVVSIKFTALKPQIS